MTRFHQLLRARGTLLAILVLLSCECSIARADEAVKQIQTDSTSQQDTNEMTTKTIPTSKRVYSKSCFDITPLSKAVVEELAKKISAEAFRVTQKSGTEPAFCGNLVDNKKHGEYCCVVCGLPLFSSQNKFNSGTGWPSFFSPVDPAHISEKADNDHGMVRTEIQCARCQAHLGHVFEDGPAPTGLRYCLNSAALVFHEKGSKMPATSMPIKSETAYFAGGCFWGVEHIFQEAPGVITAESGYMQGKKDNPTYDEVCLGDTGHAETVKVIFDPSVISFRQLMEGFFLMHDPTQVDRQGPDSGSQYRSGVFCSTPEQLTQAKEIIAKWTAEKKFNQPIATQVELAKKFYPAEEYHQDYVDKTGRVCHVGNPWSTVLGVSK